LRPERILGVLVVLASCAAPQCADDDASSGPHSVLQGRSLQLQPLGATLDLPVSWLQWHAQFANNLHLSRRELAAVRTGHGEWDKEYAAVANAMVPFSSCAAHIGAEGWGWAGVSFADTQLRVYVLDAAPAQVEAQVLSEGVAAASKLSRRVTSSRAHHGDWLKTSVTYDLWYSDYGGTAIVDVYSRSCGDQTAVLVFMHTGWEPNVVSDIVASFACPAVEVIQPKRRDAPAVGAPPPYR
jgi:hypothetical protein